MEEQPKKVVFILPSLAAGGAERVLITLMNKIDRSRFKPEFISFRRNGPLKQLIADDVIIHEIGSYKKIFFGLVPLLLKLREIKPDIAVTTMAHTNFALVMMKPFLRGTRIVIREAITPSYIFDTLKIGWFVKILYKILYPQADLVISPSQRIIDEFNELMGANTGHHKLLYNPVNIEVIRAVPHILEKQDDTRQKTVHFICAGRLHFQKGFDQLINALPFFKCDYDWKLTILGGGPERRNLEKMIKKNKLQDKVFMPGFTQAPWPQIGAADCFLMPSRFEGLPNVVLEALSVGTPVIATTTSGGIQEIADLAKPGDVQVVEDMPQFLDAMKTITPNPTRTYRKSLLPDTFETEKVVDRFMKILDARDEFNPKRIKILKKQAKKSA
ncbi:MAG TPA: glycosyltransferase [Alphaproteobacteria bacterium]|nr:glycosyltransferase [Alphaproteobacteria bacterium]